MCPLPVTTPKNISSTTASNTVSTTFGSTSEVTTTKVSQNTMIEYHRVSFHISDSDKTAYKCDTIMQLNLDKGMKFDVELVTCYVDKDVDYAINAEAGVYKFKLNVEENIEINCQFSAVFMNSENPVSKDCIQGSIKCQPYCTTIGGPESGKSCIFPFVWKGRQYGECTDIDHPDEQTSTELYCATSIDAVSLELKAWGKCSRTCGYCFGSEVKIKEAKTIALGKNGPCSQVSEQCILHF